MFLVIVCMHTYVFGHSGDNIGGSYAASVKCKAAFTVGQSLVTCPFVRWLARSLARLFVSKRTIKRDTDVSCIQSPWFTDCWSLRDALGDIALYRIAHASILAALASKKHGATACQVWSFNSLRATRCGKSELILWSADECIVVIIFPYVCFRNLWSLVLMSTFRSVFHFSMDWLFRLGRRELGYVIVCR